MFYVQCWGCFIKLNITESVNDKIPYVYALRLYKKTSIQ